jgi:inorganic pyrophosphatase
MDKHQLLKDIEHLEKVYKGQLQHYVRYLKEIPEGIAYADEKINNLLDALRKIMEAKQKLLNS